MTWFIDNETPPTPIRGAAVTIGMFDGVHRGHRALVETLLRVADGGPTVAFTFDRHPLSVLSPENAPPLLTTVEEKRILLQRLGIDHVLTFHATKELFALTADEFIATFLRGIATSKHLVVGPDFALGRGRVGDADFLAREGLKRGFAVTIVPPVTLSGAVVSSTRIRNLLTEGKVEDAAEFLGRPYSVAGETVVGRKLGRTIGFPTANISAPPEKLLPADGIYACAVEVAGKLHRAAVNVGFRPTVGGVGRTVEAHLLDFDGDDLYGTRLRCDFLRRLRGERRFDSLDALSDQIARDVEETRRVDLPAVDRDTPFLV